MVHEEWLHKRLWQEHREQEENDPRMKDKRFREGFHEGTRHEAKKWLNQLDITYVLDKMRDDWYSRLPINFGISVSDEDTSNQQ